LRKPVPLWLKQVGKFLLVGAMNTAVDYAIYFLLTRFTPFFGAQPVFAKGISFSVAVLNGFFWNRRWTFKSAVSPWVTILPFALTCTVGLFINMGLMYLFFSVLHLPELIALVLSSIGFMLWNFTISKLLIFWK